MTCYGYSNKVTPWKVDPVSVRLFLRQPVVSNLGRLCSLMSKIFKIFVCLFVWIED